ncbi:MAG: serine hydrolase [Burkholderiaceae bacterium]|nr:serine hydrolase [Burkholderiaceae bacterium]
MNAPAALLRTLSLPDAEHSCPQRLGWMQGQPPRPERRIRWDDGSAYLFPQLRWSFCHLDRLLPTQAVPRGAGPATALPLAPRGDLDDLEFTPVASRATRRFGEAIAQSYTDGILVLHRGRIVHERYLGGLAPDGPAGRHAAMSVTKSLVGTLGLLALLDGTLDAQRPLTHYLPELAGSGFAGATVDQLLDMSTALDYAEDYTDPDAGIWRHAQAGGLLPRPAGWQGPEGFDAFVRSVGPLAGASHGHSFGYRTVNADALALLLRRISGQDLPSLMSQRLWQPMGAEADAFFSVDGQGTAFGGGGLGCTLRDLARFGELLRCDGAVGPRQVLPAALVARLRAGGCPETFARARQPLLRGWTYRAMWWVTHNPHGAFMARGVHGQTLYIDPLAEMVIARFASHPLPANVMTDPLLLRAWHALGRHLLLNG